MDRNLPLFPLDEGAARLPRQEPELAVAVPASARPVWLHGTRASVLGDVRSGCREILMDGRRVVADVTTDAGPVANAVVSPGILRRERISRSGSGEETVLVAPTLPLVVFAFQGTGPASLTLTALPDAARTRYRVDGSTVTVAEEGGGQVLAVTSLPRDAAWQVGPGADGGLRLTCAASSDGSDGLRALALAWGPEASVRTALAGARHLAGHAMRAGGAVAGDHLTLRSGVPALDDAVAWMHHRLAAGVRLAAATTGGAPTGRVSTEDRADPERAASGSEAWLWCALGACAVGDVDTAVTCLDALDRLQRPQEALLLAARLALLTGRQTGVAERVAGSGGRAPLEPATSLGRLALRTAADAMRHAAPDDLVVRTRRSGTQRHDTGAPAPPASGRRLPTLGGPTSARAQSEETDAALGNALTFLLERDEGARRPTWTGRPGGPVRSALEAWTALVAGDAEGWARWRALAAEGLEASEGGVAAWDAFEPARPPATTGILLAALAHGWLGAHPDAPVGRLTLAPRVPGHVTGFRFQGIRVGDVSLDLGYARDGSSHRFELLPRGGRVPPLVVFEPVVPATEVAEVLVDGGPADVEAVTGEGVTTVRLQTPLDRTRRVEIRTR